MEGLGGGEGFSSIISCSQFMKTGLQYGLQTDAQALVCCVKTNEHKQQNMQHENQICCVHNWYCSKE
jgi:hypothetical protein